MEYSANESDNDNDIGLGTLSLFWAEYLGGKSYHEWYNIKRVGSKPRILTLKL